MNCPGTPRRITQARILEYLRARPEGASCRQVSIDVLGGAGGPHTLERKVAYQCLAELERAGDVMRVRPHDRQVGDRWHAVAARFTAQATRETLDELVGALAGPAPDDAPPGSPGDSGGAE